MGRLGETRTAVLRRRFQDCQSAPSLVEPKLLVTNEEEIADFYLLGKKINALPSDEQVFIIEEEEKTTADTLKPG